MRPSSASSARGRSTRSRSKPRSRRPEALIVTDEHILAEIQKIIGEHKVALFMKGLPEAPRCGFSARVVGRLDEAGVEVAAVDVLADPRIRQVLSAHSNWPTIPQLFVDGKLVGGCDIVEELAESGELPAILGLAQ